ncbi:RNA-binding protein 34 [Cichlidogyrus casuarinus]|uniref:RNA-binding protein 34 n=1 Tax=Cichlidogyrus casuarinus TaxID=1844966 RepID=A0ABD2Q2Q5_9PLAT
MKAKQTELKERLDRTAFVGNLPPGIDRKYLLRIFETCVKSDNRCAELGCKVETLRLRGATSKSGGISRGAKKRAAIMKEVPERGSMNRIAYVVFTHREGVDAALRLNNKRVFVKSKKGNAEESRCILVDRAVRTSTGAQKTNSIFVGNLPLSCSEDQVREVFLQFGAIERVRLVRDKATGAVKGIGFVEFKLANQAKAALAHKEPIKLDNRTLRLDRCRNMEKEEKSAEVLKKQRIEKIKKENSTQPMDFDGHLRKKIVLPTNMKAANRDKVLKKRINKIRNKIIPKKRKKESAKKNSV